MRVRDIVIGETYNGIKILKDLGRENQCRHYLGICPYCGGEMKIRSRYVGVQKSCIHCACIQNRADIIGKRFGRLVVQKYVGSKGGKSRYLCICDCGNEHEASSTSLSKGGVRSCGCLQKEAASIRVHRSLNKIRKSVSPEFSQKYPHLGKHPLYRIWVGILSRCNNPNTNGYENYGGRGIRVCDRWKRENQGFENFVKDMGERPSKKHSIDRIDVNGDYEPSNCRWATQKEQNSNQRRNAFYTFFGRTQTLKQWCEELGCNYGVVASRRHHGVSEFNQLFYGKNGKPNS